MYQTSELGKILNEYFDWNKTRMDCFTGMLLSLIAVRTVNLSEIAVGFMSLANKESRYRRLQRFFSDFNIDMEKMACFIFSLFFGKDKKLYLTIDRTNWYWGKSKINILTLAIAYEGLAIPVFYKLLDKGGNANGNEHVEIIKRFVRVFGKDCIAEVLVKFFCEKPFAVKKIFKGLNAKEQTWHVQPIVIHGQTLFISGSRSESGELLIVATNQSPKNAVAIYLRRWEIESLFQSLKTRGFRFESTHMTKPERIEKLLAVVTVAFCWAHKFGEWRAIKKPIIFKKFRNSRRPQNSYFRYGLDFLREIVLHFHKNCRQFKQCLKQLILPNDPIFMSVQEVKL